jgi:hypothetical protein
MHLAFVVMLRGFQQIGIRITFSSYERICRSSGDHYRVTSSKATAQKGLRSLRSAN